MTVLSGSISPQMGGAIRVPIDRSKRLEKGTFAKVTDGTAKTPLNSAQLQCLIDGIYWQKDKQNRRFN